MRVAIVGGGIAGLTAAWQLARLAQQGAAVEATLFEASGRLGGIVETVRRDGFTIDCGPDGWLSEKPWARELATDLGLEAELIGSNDQDRVTYILKDAELQAVPDGMRMMIPTDLAALERTGLLSREARAAYAAEPGRAKALKAEAPAQDESIASFVARHFGPEVTRTVVAPLLSGVFGGDCSRLSVRAVMPVFVQMEREHGSLVLGLRHLKGKRAQGISQPLFTSLRGGVGTLLDRLVAAIPADWLRVSTPVTRIEHSSEGWAVFSRQQRQTYDRLLLAVPAHVTRALLEPILPAVGDLIDLKSSSAITVALAFGENFPLPHGFGFLVPMGESVSLLAATFTDQKFPERAPVGKRLLRAFFGGPALSPVDARSDSELARDALADLENVLGPLPHPAFSVVRRWPESLPQYEVGHPDRMAQLEAMIAGEDGLALLGNGWRGVGLPDLIRDARGAASRLLSS